MQGDMWYGKNWSDIAERYQNYMVTYPSHEGGQVTELLILAPVNKDPYAVPKTSLDGTIRDYNYYYSDAWYRLQNGAYARLKNLTIGYTLPQALTAKKGIEKLRIYFTGNDLFEIKRNKDGYDPESTFADYNGGESGAFSYPFMRRFSFGIDITF